MRAHSIFEAKGLIKLLKEVKNKLKMLNSSIKLAAEVVASDALDSGDDSGRDHSPNKGFGDFEGKIKVKKGKKGKKKPKKTVFRNNFVKDSDSS